MKSNFPKIIVLLILIFVAYKSLSHGIKAFNARPQAVPSAESPPTDEVEVVTDVASPSLTEEADTAVSVADKKQDVLSALSDYGRVPFIAPTETKTTTQEATNTATVARKASAEAPQLTTILNYEGEWFAIVNGSLVKAGDTIGRIKILEIKENLVRVEESGKIYRLKLWQESFSK